MMGLSKRVENPVDWLTSVIKSFINDSPENTFKNAVGEKAWEKPVVGYSSGDDPLYYEFKRHIGSIYWSPIEIFTKTFPRLTVTTDRTAHQEFACSAVRTKDAIRHRAFHASGGAPFLSACEHNGALNLPHVSNNSPWPPFFQRGNSGGR